MHELPCNPGQGIWLSSSGVELPRAQPHRLPPQTTGTRSTHHPYGVLTRHRNSLCPAGCPLLDLRGQATIQQSTAGRARARELEQWPGQAGHQATGRPKQRPLPRSTEDQHHRRCVGARQSHGTSGQRRARLATPKGLMRHCRAKILAGHPIPACATEDHGSRKPLSLAHTPG